MVTNGALTYELTYNKENLISKTLKNGPKVSITKKLRFYCAALSNMMNLQLNL